MAHLSVASAIDKNRISSSAVWAILIELEVIDPNTREVVETVRIVRDNSNVIFRGEVYQAANFKFQISQRKGEAPSVTMTAQDQTRFIQQRMEEMAGGVFSSVKMFVVNLALESDVAEIEEAFQITGSSAQNDVVTFNLGAENPLAVQFPKHIQRKDRCAWRFRGYGCAYTGPMTSCDYSKDGPNGCAAHNNLARFRALPGLVRMNI